MPLLPAREVMPWSGVTVPLELTAALPPPAVCGEVEASAPITAIDLVDEPSGSIPPLFFSRTVPSALIWVPVLWLPELVVGCAGEPVGALSKSPNANISVRTREVIVMFAFGLFDKAPKIGRAHV